MRAPDDTEDLIALARRDELTPNGLRRLRSLLEASAEARLLLEAGLEFDNARSVSPGDELRVERLAQLAVRSQKAQSRRGLNPGALGLRLALGFLVCGAAATGAWSTVGFVNPQALPVAAPSVARTAPKSVMKASSSGRTVASSEAPPREPPMQPVEVSPTESTVVEAHEAALASASRGQAIVATVANAQTDPKSRSLPHSAPVSPRNDLLPGTARDLFSAANLRRRALDRDGAISLYEQLQTRFPESPEARESHLIVGTLQLRNDPRAALQQFRKDGDESPSERTPEALWGEARALRDLGRRTDERAVLELLLQSFPDSAYNDAVHRRLGELAR